MISEKQTEWRGTTNATANGIMDVVNHITNNLDKTTDHEGWGFDEKTSRIADDLDEEYQGWWGEKRFTIEIIVREA